MWLFFQSDVGNAVERVTAFIDATTRYMDRVLKSPVDGSPTPSPSRQSPRLSTQEPVAMATQGNQQGQGGLLLPDSTYQGEQQDSVIEGKQLSDCESDSSQEPVIINQAALPQYDFKMSATTLAAFLAVFNITKQKLEGAGFPV